MRPLLISIFASLAFSLPHSSFADTDCNIASNTPQQNFDRCLAEAKQGNASAQTHTAYFYSTGSGVEQNKTTAAHWYHQAALQGDAAAQASFGYLHEHGQGVAQSPAEAAKWYQLAAKQHYPMASYNLALLYAKGTGVERDAYTAYKLLLDASQAGHKNAQDTLSLFEESWFTLSSDKKCDISGSPEEFIEWQRQNNQDFHISDTQYTKHEAILVTVTNRKAAENSVSFHKGIARCAENNI